MSESPKMPPGLVEMGTLAFAALAAAEREFPRIMAELAASLPYVPVVLRGTDSEDPT